MRQYKLSSQEGECSELEDTCRKVARLMERATKLVQSLCNRMLLTHRRAIKRRKRRVGSKSAFTRQTVWRRWLAPAIHATAKQLWLRPTTTAP